MAMEDDGVGDNGAGWEDAGDTLDLRAERRKLAEERVARGGSGRAQKTTAASQKTVAGPLQPLTPNPNPTPTPTLTLTLTPNPNQGAVRAPSSGWS